MLPRSLRGRRAPSTEPQGRWDTSELDSTRVPFADGMVHDAVLHDFLVW